MRIRRMTITLPPRLRGMAEHQARLIAQQAAERLAAGAPARIDVAVEGRGAAGHGLAEMVGGRLSAVGGSGPAPGAKLGGR
ncbi:MAG: hypothetical protein WD969_15210 [Paracoccaceae bacterium]